MKKKVGNKNVSGLCGGILMHSCSSLKFDQFWILIFRVNINPGL